ncbi:hypothetical protein [Paenibacillus sp. AR247]|uniref:hypothetical protein n=1 Tax=Paenibacillus sp. AR247 TaxID=1631599 RepID=UPI000CF8D611|nr:hypothetical protein [Paenibacillus sp. AR247]PQP89667.1 hypothetical protein CPT76_16865 [Paenibacillus sp. AR247]
MPAYESRSYDILIAGMVQPMVTVSVIVKAGSGVIQRGMVLGVVGQLPEGGSSAGMYITVPVDSSKTDGSETLTRHPVMSELLVM